MDDGLDDAEEDPFTAKMSFEVREDRGDEAINIHQLGEPAGEGERTGSIIECGCVRVCVQTAGGLELCPSQGESLGAALDEQEGCPDQTLAQAAQMGILPLPAAGREHHHVPHLLQGTAFIRHTASITWCEPQTKFICRSSLFLSLTLF